MVIKKMGFKANIFGIKLTITDDDLGKVILPTLIGAATGGAGLGVATFVGANVKKQTDKSSNTSVRKFGGDLVNEIPKHPEVFQPKSELVIIPRPTLDDINLDNIKYKINKNDSNIIPDNTQKTPLSTTSQSRLKAYFDFTKNTPVLQYYTDDKRYDFSLSSLSQTKFININESDTKIGLTNKISTSGVSSGVSIFDGNKVTSYDLSVDWILSTDAEIYITRTDTWIFVDNKENNSRIASMKMSDGEIDIYNPICGKVGTIRTKTTVSGDRVSQEIRKGINVNGISCPASAIPAVRGYKIIKYGKNLVFDIATSMRLLLTYK